jgi:hypothetical protein
MAAGIPGSGVAAALVLDPIDGHRLFVEAATLEGETVVPVDLWTSSWMTSKGSHDVLHGGETRTTVTTARDR